MIDRYMLLLLSCFSCVQLCATPETGSPPSSPVPGILQARTLEWVAISFSNAWKWKVKLKSLSCVWLLVTPWTAAHQAPLSMGSSRQEYWSGVPLPSPRWIHGEVLYEIFLWLCWLKISRSAIGTRGLKAQPQSESEGLRIRRNHGVLMWLQVQRQEKNFSIWRQGKKKIF